MRKHIRSRVRALACTASLVLVTGCSTVLYQANGEYFDGGTSRRILLQWEAQEYHIPFVDANVDYGSVSLQAECVADVLLDRRDDPDLGLIFLELPQYFRLVPGAPELRVGNYLVCAKLDEEQSIEDAIGAESVQLLVLCESRTNDPFLPASLAGYALSVSSHGSEETLGCDI